MNTPADFHTMTRNQLIALLVANNPNGCYTDEQAAAEDCRPLTKDEAVQMAVCAFIAD